MPFAVVGVAALVTVVASALRSDRLAEMILTLLAVVATVSFLAVGLRRPRRTWVDSTAVYAAVLVIALARDLTGGSSSSLGALLVLPILWTALTGTRAEQLVVGVLAASVFVVPALVVGAPRYESSDWGRAGLWLAIAWVIAPVIHGIVLQLGSETQRARAAHDEVAAIMEGARLTSIVATDVHGSITSFSAGAETLLGYRAEDMLGRTPRVFHDDAEVAQVAEELGVAPGFAVFAELARRSAPSRTWTYLRSDGERIYVRLAITELHNGDTGAVTGYLGVAIDSTPAVVAERARAATEARWRVLVDNLPELTVVMVDEHLTIRAAAGGGAGPQGFRGSEGQHLEAVSSPTNMRILRPLINRALTGRAGTHQLRAAQTGTEHEITVTPLPPEDDGPRALVLARDVGRERERERAILAAKQRAERLFADAPQGVALLSPLGVILESNASFQSLVGMAADELDGTRLSLLTAYPETVEEMLARAQVQPHQAVESPLTIQVDGREVHVGASCRLLAGDLEHPDSFILNLVDLSDRHRYEQELARLAERDALTGLYNRRRFDHDLGRHMDLCRASTPRGALLLLDLDHFKEVNDTLGHQAGDELIRAMADVLRHRLRQSDVVARLGGDEFAVLLPDADLQGAEVVAASIVEGLRELTRGLPGALKRVTTSIGVVTVQAALQRNDDILALADMTMYDAKESGRNQYAVLEEDTGRLPQLESRLRWKEQIETALEQDLFELHLQPILELRTNRVRSAEALLRLRSEGSVIAPAEFLEVAERTGLIEAVDVWVIEHAVALLARLRSLDPAFELEVNLSGHSIGDPRIEQAIRDALARHEVDASGLVLEITETAAVRDIELARAFAERMTVLGCKFALDDFGAGFGSFYYLKHLIFDYLKIDGEFVSHCATSTVDTTILKSIVGIARDLGKRTIAEYVSDAAVAHVVDVEGVDLAQGYFIGRPVEPEEFIAEYLSVPASPGPVGAGPVGGVGR